MKTISSILKKGIQIIIIVANTGTTSLAGDNDKMYQITDDGDYRYQYLQAEQSNKADVKPVTVRTFYLETKRKGLIPNIDYRDFLQMSVEEQQALLTDQPYLSIDKNEPKPSGKMLKTTNATEKPSDKVALTSDPVFYPDRNLPWIVQVTVDPHDGYKLPQINENQWAKSLNLSGSDNQKTNESEVIIENTNTCPVTTNSTVCNVLP